MSSTRHILEIILGPTGVGKTEWAIQRAKAINSPIISCDSRQLYREMTIGTAVPTKEQLASVKHYFIQDHSIHEPYTAGMYELEAVDLVERLFAEADAQQSSQLTASKPASHEANVNTSDRANAAVHVANEPASHETGTDAPIASQTAPTTLIMCGGSPFYIDAFCNGLDAFPPADLKTRDELMERLGTEGLASLVNQLRQLDPISAETLEMTNPQRVVRALEVCLMTSRPFSSFKTAPKKERSFEIKKIGLARNREELYARIDARAKQMFDDGLVEEAKRLQQYRQLPALQTVGYNEVFDYLDGKITLDQAIGLVQRNSRRYAKRQLSWWRRDPSIEWIEL